MTIITLYFKRIATFLFNSKRSSLWREGPWLTKECNGRYQDVISVMDGILWPHALVWYLCYRSSHVVSGCSLSRCQPVNRRWKVNNWNKNGCMTSSTSSSNLLDFPFLPLLYTPQGWIVTYLKTATRRTNTFSVLKSLIVFWIWHFLWFVLEQWTRLNWMNSLPLTVTSLKAVEKTQSGIKNQPWTQLEAECQVWRFQ